MNKVVKRNFNKIKKSAFKNAFLKQTQYRTILMSYFSFFINLIYALYNGFLGLYNQSVWFIALFGYYIILSIMRFSVVLCEFKSNKIKSNNMEYFVMKLYGGLLSALSFILICVVYVSLTENITAKHESILMITIATYTFYKIIAIIIRTVKQHKNISSLLAVIHTVCYADIAASIMTLQRSMLASFGSLDDVKAYIMNILTGAVVCIFVFMLGLNMIIKGVKGKEDKYG